KIDEPGMNGGMLARSLDVVSKKFVSFRGKFIEVFFCRLGPLRKQDQRKIALKRTLVTCERAVLYDFFYAGFNISCSSFIFRFGREPQSARCVDFEPFSRGPCEISSEDESREKQRGHPREDCQTAQRRRSLEMQ